MQAKIYNKKGKEAGMIELPGGVFDLPWNADLVHQVYTSQQSNMRGNTVKTKDRSEVSGTGKKTMETKGNWSRTTWFKALTNLGERRCGPRSKS
jgi:ribosomal protein L4